jgi:hypothetical protein
MRNVLTDKRSLLQRPEAYQDWLWDEMRSWGSIYRIPRTDAHAALQVHIIEHLSVGGSFFACGSPLVYALDYSSYLLLRKPSHSKDGRYQQQEKRGCDAS